MTHVTQHHLQDACFASCDFVPKARNNLPHQGCEAIPRLKRSSSQMQATLSATCASRPCVAVRRPVRCSANARPENPSFSRRYACLRHARQKHTNRSTHIFRCEQVRSCHVRASACFRGRSCFRQGRGRDQEEVSTLFGPPVVSGSTSYVSRVCICQCTFQYALSPPACW